MRPLTYDLTHLVSRLTAKYPTGIDLVDLAYGREFAGPHPVMTTGTHYGLTSAHRLTLATSQRIVRMATANFDRSFEANDSRFEALWRWLCHEEIGRAPQKPRTKPPLTDIAARYLHQLLFRCARDFGEVPRNTIYLNVAQHSLESPFYFRWLDRRPDILPVFYIHDLIPLDYPEYFPAGYRAIFERRIDTMLHHARALITHSGVVRDRMIKEIVSRGGSPIPIHVEHLPSPLSDRTSNSTRSGDPTSYFVVVGTIEPRKNHLMLLNIWRDIVRTNTNAPKLVVVGARGWENEQTVDMLERCASIKGYVTEISSISPADMSQLVRGANALLMPSFEEGFGLPLVEALEAGTPVIASDISAFREATQGHATFIAPNDGHNWKEAILGMTEQTGNIRLQAITQARKFRPCTWSDYFGGIRSYLASL